MGRRKFKEYGVPEVIQAMEAVVARAGADFVYHKVPSGDLGICRYMHSEDTPGCLIGQVLIELGALPKVIWAAEESYVLANDHGIGVEEFLELLSPTWGTLGYTITPEAATVLSAAQNVQDVGNTWGRALEVAKQEVRNLEVSV